MRDSYVFPQIIDQCIINTFSEFRFAKCPILETIAAHLTSFFEIKSKCSFNVENSSVTVPRTVAFFISFIFSLLIEIFKS